MVKNLINEIEQAMLGSLNNEQLAQLRKVLDYTFRNIVVTEKMLSMQKVIIRFWLTTLSQQKS